MKIKGNTQIILSDAKTGKVVKQTNDDNMVTNGVFEFIRSHGMTVPDLFNNNDIKANPLTTLLGGVYLFHDSQTEDVDNIKPDGGNALTANGAYDITTAQGRTLGNFNSGESGWMSDNIFRFVYDWATSQGNGVISSVSLTSRIAGMLGMGRNVKPLSNVYLDSFTSYSPTFNERDMTFEDYLGIHYDNVFGIIGNYLYSYHIIASATQPSSDHVVKHFEIHRQHICNTEMAFDDSKDLKPLTNSRVEFVASFEHVADDTEGNTYPVIHAHGYFWMLTSYQQKYHVENHTEDISGVAWRMLRIKDDFTTCEICEIDGSQEAFNLSDDYNDRLDEKMVYELDRQAGFFPTSANTFSLYACKGHGKDSLHTSPWFSYQLYNCTFDTQNPTVVDGGDVHKYSENYNPSMNLNSNILYHANGVSCGKNWIGTEDGDIWECELFADTGARGAGCSDESLCCLVASNGQVRVGRVADYLASINNLSSAVTKDNTQNMKLIYTLTFTD